ncbi:universal stress protein [Mucilaginibacter boryungensis]|uniref:Universal stress protein n=1 Tax=Mucilaginibacter boryungensis TaxID=768480 RepID=A0ABR9XFA3_9SPHI|nr:universal stress protein [Mucilaginibacter boryungensis]MBE9665689.1 universal stress protein [Mucilaginibacter boryungensis]
MKTFLIATDFSANARFTAAYGYSLAQQIKARVVLCHAMNVPAEIPQSGAIAWPMDVYDDLTQDSNDELAKLKSRLISEGDIKAYQPEVSCVHEAGFVADVLNAEAAKFRADMIIIGMHGNDAFGTWMIGNHSRKLIEAAITPLLLVPAGTMPKPIKRIAFGSDFKQPDKDIKTISELVDIAQALDAELILTHIEQPNADAQYTAIVKQLLMELIGKSSHGKVSYKVVKSDHVEHGLNWLVQHAHIDILAVVHRDHNFFDQLVNGSHTQKAAKVVTAPLLVFKN